MTPVISRLSARSANRQLSMSETVEPVLAKIEYPEKERKIQFKNSWNRVSTCFIFHSPNVRNSIKKKLLLIFARTTIPITA
jgi:hypothetical protein